MAAASGVQPPNQSPGSGLNRNRLPNKPMFNSWTENTRIKTCKCEICGERVRVSSQKCDGCGRHVCSECLDPSSSKRPYYKDAARNQMEVGCWGCNWRSNMNPAFASRKPPPEPRLEEERRAKASKALGVQRRAAAQAAARRAAAAQQSPEQEDSGFNLEQHASSTGPIDEGEYRAKRPCRVAMRDLPRRLSVKRKCYTEDDSNSEISVGAESDDVSKNAMNRPKQESSEEAFTETTARVRLSTTPTEPIATPEWSPLTDLPDPSTRISPLPHLEGQSTVIVGAGVVGLFVAYELAIKLRAAGIVHDITVVEIRAGYCELASGACAGILSTSDIPGQWSKVTNYAQQCWQQIISIPDFFDKVYLGAGTVFSTCDHETTGEKILPSWLSGCSIVGDTRSFGRIDTAALASWLFHQCKALDVGFFFNHSVCDTEFGTTKSVLTHVYVENGLGKKTKIQCQNLVLAAGPFTTQLFDSLFSNATVELENNIQGAHSLHVALEEVANDDKIALRLANAAKHVRGLEDEIMMVVLEPTNNIAVSAISSKTFAGNLEFERARDPRKSKTTDLRQIAAKYFNSETIDLTDRVKNPGKYRSELSTANGCHPIIDSVPTSGLGCVCHHPEYQNPSCVWLCYGFGRHGTTLAPGAARMIVSRMLHGADSIDNYDFSLPEYTPAKPVNKGKGRAMD